MSYTGENVARIRQAWVANANEGEPKPLCVILSTALSAKDVVVDLYIRDGILEGAKLYHTSESQKSMLQVGVVPS